MDFQSFRESIVSPALQAVVRHWDEARGGALLPSWDQIRPSRIARFLPWVWAFKFDKAENQFAGRLAGGQVARAFDKNFRGLPLNQALPPEVAAKSHQLMSRIIAEPVVYRCAGDLFKHGGHIFEGERIALPLASDGIHGDGVLGVSAYDYPYFSRDVGRVELLLEAHEWFSISRGTAK